MQKLRTWDPERIREVVGDDREILLELVALFVDDTQQRMTVLKHSVHSADLTSTRHEAHAIKGAAGNFGAEALYEIAKHLEDRSRGGDLSAARSLFLQMERAFAELTTALHQADVGV